MWAEYDRDTYYWLKQGHFCTKCRKQDAYTLNGRSLCYECSVKDAKRHRDKRISNNEKVRKHDREHRNSLIEKGICPKCKSRPLTKGYKSCAYCRAKIRKQNHKHNLKKGCIPREMKYSIIIPTIEKIIHTTGHSFEYDELFISSSAQSPEVKFSEASLKNSIMAVLRLQTFQEVPMPYRLQ